MLGNYVCAYGMKDEIKAIPGCKSVDLSLSYVLREKWYHEFFQEQVTELPFLMQCVLLTVFFRDYVRSELESAYEGPMYLEPLSLNRFTTALIGKYC